MKKVYSSIVSVLLVAVLSSYHTHLKEVTTIKGIVVEEQTSKPLSGVLVYVTAGEEECLTKDNGKFLIETMQKIPLTVTAERWGYVKKTVRVTEPGKQMIIQLAKKE